MLCLVAARGPYLQILNLVTPFDGSYRLLALKSCVSLRSNLTLRELQNFGTHRQTDRRTDRQRYVPKLGIRCLTKSVTNKRTRRIHIRLVDLTRCYPGDFLKL